MTIHICKCESKIKKNMQAYCIGKSIILPHVRFIENGKCMSRMFHSHIINSHGHFHTLGCNRMDFSGLCLGHKMSKEEFLKQYCGGVEPERQTKKDKEV